MPPEGQQLRMASALDDAPMVEEQDLVRVDHRRQAMGDDEGRPPLRHPAQRLLDLVLGETVER